MPGSCSRGYSSRIDSSARIHFQSRRKQHRRSNPSRSFLFCLLRLFSICLSLSFSLLSGNLSEHDKTRVGTCHHATPRPQADLITGFTRVSIRFAFTKARAKSQTAASVGKADRRVDDAREWRSAAVGRPFFYPMIPRRHSNSRRRSPSGPHPTRRTTHHHTTNAELNNPPLWSLDCCKHQRFFKPQATRRSCSTQRLGTTDGASRGGDRPSTLPPSLRPARTLARTPLP